MKKLLFICLSLSFVFCSNSDSITEYYDDGAIITGEIAIQYSKTITPEDLKTHLYIIASDEFEGRDTGEPGQKLAAEYLKDFYKSQNIASPLGGDDYFQDISTEHLRPNLKPSENVVAFIEGSIRANLN